MTVDYRAWIGRKQTAEETITLQPARRLAATLDDTAIALNEGSPLPPLWHWLYFLPDTPQSKMGSDGHGERGDFLPPIDLPRRMFAGAALRFLAPLRIGARATRTSEVVDVTEKTGRTGKLAFVKVMYSIAADGAICVEETADIVYREAGPPAALPEPKPWAPPPAGAWVREIKPDPVLLFRFSALTFNAHRIHYDRPYTREVEGYPGLLVHGPLLATLLVELVRHNTAKPVEAFTFRAEAPVFDTAPFRLIGVAEGNTVSLTAERVDGVPAMRATAVLRRS